VPFIEAVIDPLLLLLLLFEQLAAANRNAEDITANAIARLLENLIAMKSFDVWKTRVELNYVNFIEWLPAAKAKKVKP
jgi:hypothetical protein